MNLIPNTAQFPFLHGLLLVEGMLNIRMRKSRDALKLHKQVL
jgi:hypothetical protein